MDAPKATAAYAVMAQHEDESHGWVIAVYRDKADAEARVKEFEDDRIPGRPQYMSYDIDEVDFFEAAP